MIIPAIIPKSLDDLVSSLEKVKFATTIQIDVVDGIFVPFVSWPYEPSGKVIEIKGFLTQFEIEVDLMVSDPLSAAKDWLGVGANRLVFHLESFDEVEKAVALKQVYDFDLGFSINNDTPIEVLLSHIEEIDFVQLMGIKDIGVQGQPFDIRVVERVMELKNDFPNLQISIDGSVNQETIISLKKAGASRFVSGSAIVKSNNPEAAYMELKNLADQN